MTDIPGELARRISRRQFLFGGKNSRGGSSDAGSLGTILGAVGIGIGVMALGSPAPTPGGAGGAEIFSCTNLVEPITYTNASSGSEGTPAQRSRVVIDTRNTEEVYGWCIGSVSVDPTVGSLRWDIASASSFAGFVVLAETDFGTPAAGILTVTPIDPVPSTHKIKQAWIRCMAQGDGVDDPVIQKAGLVFTKA